MFDRAARLGSDGRLEIDGLSVSYSQLLAPAHPLEYERQFLTDQAAHLIV